MTEEQRQLCIDFQAAFGTPQGMRALAAIKAHSTYEARYNPNVHPSVTWCDLGMREMYLFIKDKVEANTADPVHQDVAETHPGENKQGRRQETALNE